MHARLVGGLGAAFVMVWAAGAGAQTGAGGEPPASGGASAVGGASAGASAGASVSAGAGAGASASASAGASDGPTTSSGADALELRADAASQRVGADLYWWSAKFFGSTFALVPYLSYGLGERLFLDVKLPLSMNLGARDDKLRAGLGNPTVGLHYAFVTSPSTTWYVGGRIGVPLASLADDRDWSLSNTLGAFTTALYDLHLYTDNAVPIGVIGGVESRVAKNLFVRGDVQPTLYIRTREKGREDAVEVGYQLRGEGEVRGASGWGGGVAFTVVHLVTSSAEDNGQGAIDLFGSYAWGEMFARFGMLFAVDAPLGSGFDTGKVLTFHGGIGTRF